MKSDFSIGDRVQISALGASRCPRLADKTGTIVGRSIYVNSVGVLFDGNKSPSTIHRDYLEAILSVMQGETSAALRQKRSSQGQTRLRVLTSLTRPRDVPTPKERLG
jgi:hypothetical protein